MLDSWYNVTMTDEDQLETSANARLIATAPDLLEACKAALEDIYNTLPDEGKLFLEGDARESVTLLEAAIKAAEEEGRA